MLHQGDPKYQLEAAHKLASLAGQKLAAAVGRKGAAEAPGARAGCASVRSSSGPPAWRAGQPLGSRGRALPPGAAAATTRNAAPAAARRRCRGARGGGRGPAAGAGHSLQLQHRPLGGALQVRRGSAAGGAGHYTRGELRAPAAPGPCCMLAACCPARLGPSSRAAPVRVRLRAAVEPRRRAPRPLPRPARAGAPGAAAAGGGAAAAPRRRGAAALRRRVPGAARLGSAARGAGAGHRHLLRGRHGRGAPPAVSLVDLACIALPLTTRIWIRSRSRAPPGAQARCAVWPRAQCASRSVPGSPPLA
jgi:hypothetical protein